MSSVNRAKIRSLAVLERDINQDVMLVWSFPVGLDVTHGNILVLRSGLKDMDMSFRFAKFKNCWQYFLAIPIESKLKQRVKAACIVVLAEQFNPEKFHKLLIVLTNMYKQDVSPKPLMRTYLQLFRKSEIEGWSDSKFDNRRALIAGSIKSVVKTFGVQSVLIWAAILLKKRIFVYGEQVSSLLSTLRTFPLFGAWHRQDWSMLRPLVCLSPSEMEDLKMSKWYVVGSTDSRCSSKDQLYDLLVDLTSAKITVPAHAQASITMTKFHKKMADAFVKAGGSESDQGVIKVIALKTKELIDQVKSLQTKLGLDKLTLAGLAGKVPPSMHRFLFDVAVAEGIAG
ncbi:hypothetical protein AAMO2058_001311900 [Amorphochlora amoebiformis]